ncbi:hypothetical protein ACWEVD_28340 [Nocardia thailandica]
MSATVVMSSAASVDPGPGSIEHAARAARACLERAGVGPADVDVLINVGVYRDGNVVEPSNAALIQREIGMHLDYESGSSRPGFSLDLRNGARGVLDAVQAAGALIANGTAERVLVVGSDAHPGGDHDRFPFATAGGALLLGRGVDGGSGFGRVYLAPVGSAPQAVPGVRGHLELAAMGREGARSITIDVAPDFAERAIEAAERAVRTYLAAEADLDPAATIVLTNNPVPGLAEGLAAGFGFRGHHQAATVGRQAVSAGLILALDEYQATPGQDLLLVATGAGPNAGCVRYRVPTR